MIVLGALSIHPRCDLKKQPKAKRVSAFSAIYDKQIARRLEWWWGVSASYELLAFIYVTANHIIAQHSTPLSSPHCHNGVEVCFSHCFAAHFRFCLFVCSQLIFSHSFWYGRVCLQAKAIMFCFFGLPKAFCVQNDFSQRQNERKRERQREICKQRQQRLGDSSDDLDMNPVWHEWSHRIFIHTSHNTFSV